MYFRGVYSAQDLFFPAAKYLIIFPPIPPPPKEGEKRNISSTLYIIHFPPLLFVFLVFSHHGGLIKMEKCFHDCLFLLYAPLQHIFYFLPPSLFIRIKFHLQNIHPWKYIKVRITVFAAFHHIIYVNCLSRTADGSLAAVLMTSGRPSVPEIPLDLPLISMTGMGFIHLI